MYLQTEFTIFAKRHNNLNMSEFENLVQEIIKFRQAIGLSQKEFGQKIGLSVRQINYIESGQRGLKNHELRSLYTSFQNEMPSSLLDLIPLEIKSNRFTRSNTTPFIDESQFVSGQQGMLSKYEKVYSIWLLNMADIAMLNSNSLRDCWVNNISNGVNYSVIWDLSYNAKHYNDAFEEFKSACNSILLEVSKNVGNNGVRNDQKHLSAEKQMLPGIDVYGTYLSYYLQDVLYKENELISNLPKEIYDSLPATPLSRLLLYEYLMTMKKYTSLENKRLRFHIPIPEEALLELHDDWRFYKDATIRSTGTVQYIPNPDEAEKLGAPYVMVIEPREASRDFFDKDESIDGFLFFADNSAKELAKSLQSFEKWHKERFQGEDKINKFQKVFNSNAKIKTLTNFLMEAKLPLWEK